MVTVKDKNNKIELTENELKEARVYCNDFVGKSNRNRAVSNILGIKIAKKYLYENGLNPNDNFSAYKIKRILEDFDIADIRIDGKIVDVRVVFNENLLFIPKTHYEYGIVPSFYMFIKINKDLETGEVLGFLEPNKVEEGKSSVEHYFPEKENLISIKLFKQKLKKIPYNDYPIKNAREVRKDIIDYCDGLLENKTRFIKLVMNNEDVRKAMLEFENAEDLFSNISEDFKDYVETTDEEKIPVEDLQDDEIYYDDYKEEDSEYKNEDEITDTVQTFSELEDTSEPLSIEEVEIKDAPYQEQEAENLTLEDNTEAEVLDSETIDYLDPENTDIEMTKEIPSELPQDDFATLDFVDETNETALSTETVSEELPATSESMDFSSNQSDDLDDFLILDTDEAPVNNNTNTVDSLSIEEEQPHKLNSEAINNLIIDDYSNTDLKIEEDELPKLEGEDLPKLEGDDFITNQDDNIPINIQEESIEKEETTEPSNESKDTKKVETDLDKLFNSGLSEESDEFENDNIAEQEEVQDEIPQKIEDDVLENDFDEVNSQTQENRFPELEELDDIFEDKPPIQRSKKTKIRVAILISAGTLLILSAAIAGVTAYMFNNVDVARFDENPANKVQVKDIPLNPEPEPQKEGPIEGIKNLDLPKEDEKEFYVLPPTTTNLEPNGFDIKNVDVSWDIPEICVDTPEKKNKLLTVGRKIKLALSNDLLLTDEKPTQKNIIINLVVKDNVLKSGNIQSSSGSKTIDKLVIQTVNDILRYSKFTIEGLTKETGYPSLIISF